MPENANETIKNYLINFKSFKKYCSLGGKSSCILLNNDLAWFNTSAVNPFFAV